MACRSWPLTCTPSHSRASVEVYESLSGEVTRIQQSQTDLQTLVDGARKLITEKLIPSPGNTYRHTNKNGPVSLNLDAVISAMLAFSGDCGGEKGTRYVASAVTACSGKDGGDDDDVVHALVALGVTWLTHFLFVLKAGMHYENHANRNLREAGCPLQSKLCSGKGGTGSPSSYKRVIARDGYRCPVTEFQDLSHPTPIKKVSRVELRKAHILCRLVDNLASDEALDSFSSARIAFEILANLAHLPFKTLGELNSHIDDPANSFMLEDARRVHLYRFQRWMSIPPTQRQPCHFHRPQRRTQRELYPYGDSYGARRAAEPRLPRHSRRDRRNLAREWCGGFL
ncbi:hypothetical protein BJ912DRAFT_982930 [Pholiota molesta]|nr:hypothetical protein BJ912DRAFT_982930 [Pholiota molesta]